MHAALDTGLTPPDAPPVAPEQSLVPLTGSMGSRYFFFRADLATVLEFSRLRLEGAFRRVFLDPVRGLVVLMAPGRTHEDLVGLADSVVLETALALGLDMVPLRATRWRRPSDAPNTGAEPDCCFYVGDTARAYRAIRLDPEAADEWALAHPPDLVVEVESTHVDRAKQAYYRELGVPECWRVSQARDGMLRADFLDLQAPENPVTMEESNTLPGLTPQALTEAVRAVSQSQLSQHRDAVRQVLDAHGLVAVDNPAQTLDDPGASTPSM